MPTIGEVVPFSTVIEKMRSLAGDEGYTVASCKYFNDCGEPVCIVGKVLAMLGVRPVLSSTGYGAEGYRFGDMLASNGSFFANPSTFAESLPWEKAGVEAPTGLQLSWVQVAQAAQDKGEPWGDAIAAADAEIGVL